MSRVLFLAGLPVVAQASPFDLAHSGRVLDAQGSPVSGRHAVELTLFDVDSGSELWSADYANVVMSQGYYSVTLTGLDTQWFGRSVELEVAVGGTIMGERSPLVSVPHALVAASIPAGTVASGSCESAGQMFYDTSTHSVLACNWDGVVRCRAGCDGPRA